MGSPIGRQSSEPPPTPDPAGAAPDLDGVEFRHNPEHERFELWRDGELVAMLGYNDCGELPEMTCDATHVAFMHTVVLEELWHHGLAGELVRGALDRARELGWRVHPVCSYVSSWVDHHPGYADLVL